MDVFVTTLVRSALEFSYRVTGFFLKIWLLPLNSMFDWFGDRIKPLFDPLFIFLRKNKTKLLRISIYTVIAFILVGIVSLSNYFIIYSYYVPKVSTEEPLYFDFGRKISASAEVAVEFQRNKLYDIYLNLEMPESPKNEEAGMFMACLDIENQDKWNPQKILHSCKPGILKYRSPITKFFRTLTYMIPNLFGITDEKQILSIPMVENLLSKRFYQTISVNVNIQNPDIQIYKASLVFQAKLSGLEFYLYHYPYLSFVIGFSSLFLFWTFSSLFMIVSLYLYRFFKNPPVKEEQLEVLPFDSDNEDLTEEQKKKKKQLYSELDEVLNPLPSSSSIASSSSSNASSSKSPQSQYVWEQELKEIDLLVNKKKKQQEFDTNNNNINSNNNENNNTIGNDIKIGKDITKSLSTPEVKVEKIEESTPENKSRSGSVGGEEKDKNDSTPIVKEEPSSLSTSSSLISIDSDDNHDEDNTTDTPTPPSTSDGETYGNSGNLGHDDWQLVGSKDQDDETSTSIRKRK